MQIIFCGNFYLDKICILIDYFDFFKFCLETLGIFTILSEVIFANDNGNDVYKLMGKYFVVSKEI